MIPSIRSLFLIAVAGMILCGCSGNSTQPVSPDDSVPSPELTVREELDANSDGTGHYLMNYGYIFVDPNHPDGPQFEVVPVRQGEIHLNILKLLEIAPCDDCFRVVGFDFPEPDKLNIDIQIDHPLDDLLYSVFDVRGIMMFNGSHEFPVAGKSISDPALGDGAVLNPDGYTALYNGSTITAPVGDLQKYFQGKLATWMVPDSDINGYKYFITDDPLNNRNAFYAGSWDVQTFSLQLPAGSFVIGYAVDANWWPPIETPVDDPLTDFDIDANCPEPWKVVVTEQKIGYGLRTTGGLTRLLIDVYDWQGKLTHHAPLIECPELFDGVLTGTWVSNEADYTRFEKTVSNYNHTSVGNYICLIGVEAIENNPYEAPWLDLRAYQTYNLEVVDNTDGDIIWAKHAGGSSSDYGNSITTLADNSIIVTGRFLDSATFGQGEPNETVLISAGDSDVFIARYNPDGNLVWVKQIGGIDWDRGNGIDSFSDDTSVVCGRFSDSATFGQGEPNEIVLNSAGGNDIFIARYDPDGSLAWAKQAGGSNGDIGYCISTQSDSSAVVSGYFGYPLGVSATFGQGEPNETTLNSAGGVDMFIAKYNADGTLAWAKQVGGTDWDVCKAITTLSDDSTVITGYFEASATFGQGEPNEIVLESAGGNDIFISRYSPDGSLVWVKQAGGAAHFDGGYGIATYSDDSIVVTGEFSQSATFGLGEPNETVLDSGGFPDIFIARYNPDGSLVWVKQAGGSSMDEGRSIITLSDNSTVVTGVISKNATFGIGELNETILNFTGITEIFIARFDPDGSLAWVKQAGGPDYDKPNGITVLTDDSTVLTGEFQESATFGQGEPYETNMNSNGSRDIFIARYAP